MKTFIFFLLAAANLVHAGSPVWDITPLTETSISIPQNGSAVVRYFITNKSRKSHTLAMNTIPGITQDTSGSYCKNPFTLGYQQSCTLKLNITGSQLTGNVNGGPIVCEQAGNGLQCYQPKANYILNITLTEPETTAAIAVTGSPLILSAGGTSGTMTVTNNSRIVTATNVVPILTSTNLDGNVTVTRNGCDSILPLQSCTITFTSLTTAVAATNFAIQGDNTTVGTGNITIADANLANISVTGTPLSLTAEGTFGTMTVTNNSATVTASNVVPVLASTNLDGKVTFDASRCASVLPLQSCTITFTPLTTAVGATNFAIQGSNTTTGSGTISISAATIANISVTGSPLNLTAEGAKGTMTVTNNSRVVTATNVVPVLSPTNLYNNVTFTRNGCDSIAPLQSCTITFTPLSTAVSATNFAIQGDNTTAGSGSITISAATVANISVTNSPLILTAEGAPQSMTVTNKSRVVTATNIVPVLASTNLDGNVTVTQTGCDSILPLQSCTITFTPLSTAVSATNFAIQGDNTTSTTGNITIAAATVANITLSNSPLTLYTSSMPGTMTVTNNSRVVTATNVAPVLIPTNLDGNVTFTRTGCDSIAPLDSCTITFTPLSTAVSATNFSIQGDNTTTISGNITIAPSAIITISNSPLSLVANGAQGSITVNNTSSVLTATNIAPVLTGTVLAGKVTVDASSCASVAPLGSCTITFTPLSSTVTATNFNIQGTNTTPINASISIASAPTFTSISPNNGPAVGGVPVTLTGTGLSGTTAVTFGGVAATSVKVVNSTTVTAVAPVGTAGQQVDVQVTTPSGVLTLAAGFTYNTTTIGQLAYGGKIACLNGGLNNLIAATADNSTSIVWGNPTIKTAATSTSDGATNTNTIVSVLGTNGGTAYAAQLCKNYQVDNQGNTPCQIGNTCYNDWFLPSGNNTTSSGQLNCLYVNKTAIGGFTTSNYWSSTESSVTDSFRESLNSGTITTQTKTVYSPVRCVRTISPPNTPVLSVTNSPLTLLTNGLTGSITVNNTSTLLTATNIVPVLTGTALDGKVTVNVSSNCASIAPLGSCTISFTPLSSTVAATSFNIQGSNTTITTASISIASTPTFTSISPNSGPAAGGVAVTLTGTGLLGSTAVTFGGVAATSVKVVNSTTVTAVAPVGTAEQQVDVQVTTPSGVLTLAAGFTYNTTAIGQLAYGGKIACLNGGLNNLIAATADNSTAIAWGNSTTTTAATSTSDGATNTNTIVSVLGTNGGTAYAAQLCKNYQVDNQGNTPCQAGNTCYDDWFLPSGNNTTSSGQLNCLYVNKTAIGGFTTSNYWSSTESSVTNSFRESLNTGTITTQTKIFNSLVRCVRTISPPNTPVLSVTNSPLTLLTNGLTGSITVNNTSSILTATNIVPVLTGTALDGKVTVNVSSNCASIAPLGSCTISFTPLSSIVAATSFNIQGSNTTITTASISIASTPTFTSISPNSGPAAGGVAVTLTGTGLSESTAVTFGGVAATSIKVVNSTTITAVAPAGNLGAVDIQITTPSGGVTLASGFTYVATAIGQAAYGGKIACLGGGLNNLIAATADNSTGIIWGGSGTSTAATSTSDGLTNTNTIITVLGTNSGIAYAAQLCKNYQVDSQGNAPCQTGNTCYNDWFLPATFSSSSSGQLACLNTNRVAVGGFSNTVYWSSTELSTTNAAGTTFGGANGTQAKTGSLRVRCVRALTLSNIATLSVSGSPLSLTAYGLAGSMIITNTSSTVTATNVSAVLAGTALDGKVTVSSTTCSSIAPLSSCTLSFTPLATAVAATSFNIQGTNTTAVSASITIAAASGASISVANSPLTLVTNGASGGLKVTNNSSGVTVTNIAPILTGTALDGKVTVDASSCASVAPLESCTINFTPLSSTVASTSFNIQGANTTTASASIAIASAPTFASISPNSGAAAGGVPVTLTGTGLSESTAVTFGGLAATSVKVVNSTTVTAVAPAGNLGAVDVQITTPSGGLTLSNGFTYVATAIGQPAYGGKIACLGGGLYDLIAATADNSAGIIWGGTGTTTGATSSSDGANNTNTIVSVLGTNGGIAYAAQLCKNYQVDNQGNTPCQTGNTCYNDWFLPATVSFGGAGQLGCLNTNSVAIGGFSNTVYWSSSEIDTANAAGSNIKGSNGTFAKSNLARVRCVRTISPPNTAILSATNSPLTLVANGAAGSITVNNTSSVLTATNITPVLAGTALDGKVTVDVSSNCASVAPLGSCTVNFTPLSSTVAATNFNIQGSNTTTVLGNINIISSGHGVIENTSLAAISVSNSSLSLVTNGPKKSMTVTNNSSILTATNVTPVLAGTSLAGQVKVDASDCASILPLKSCKISFTPLSSTVEPTNFNIQGDNVATTSVSLSIESASSPTFTSIFPISGSNTGGVSVILSGSGLSDTIGITFGGVSATSFNVVDSNTVTAVTPPGNLGAVDVQVITSRDLITLTNAFTYVAARVGQSAFGGVLACLNGGINNLVAASVDNSRDIIWGDSDTVIDTLSPSDGETNTNMIISILGNNNGKAYAAKLCSDYQVDNQGNSPCVSGNICYDDWFLPAGKDSLSTNQIDCLYSNRTAIGGFNTDENYWSSNEMNSMNAFVKSFTNGNFTDSAKISSNAVRCVRTLFLPNTATLNVSSYAPLRLLINGLSGNIIITNTSSTITAYNIAPVLTGTALDGNVIVENSGCDIVPPSGSCSISFKPLGALVRATKFSIQGKNTTAVITSMSIQSLTTEH